MRFTLFILAGILLFTFLITPDDEKSLLEESIEEYQVVVGNSVVLQGDTLLVIDYSFTDSNFTLEDNRTIAIELYRKLEHIDN